MVWGHQVQIIKQSTRLAKVLLYGSLKSMKRSFMISVDQPRCFSWAGWNTACLLLLPRVSEKQSRDIKANLSFDLNKFWPGPRLAQSEPLVISTVVSNLACVKVQTTSPSATCKPRKSKDVIRYSTSEAAHSYQAQAPQNLARLIKINLLVFITVTV